MSEGMSYFVYVIAIGGDDGPFKKPVKIGMTGDPDARLQQIRPCSPFPLSYFFKVHVGTRNAARWIEQRAHENASYELLDYEWFNLSPEEAREVVIEAIRQSRGKNVQAA